ncbi:hypothetical protein RB195_022017 [Necator americanus]|uniref:Uncharacterized protein n=1 Tax=Necator americanus TaxID=51031 RepID=A0ABR1EFV2_NECAM
MYRDNRVLSYRSRRPFLSVIKATKGGRAIYPIHDGEGYRSYREIIYQAHPRNVLVYGVGSSECIRQTDCDVEEDALVNGATVFVSETLYRPIVPTADIDYYLQILGLQIQVCSSVSRVRVLAPTIHMASGRLPAHPTLVAMSVRTK